MASPIIDELINNEPEADIELLSKNVIVVTKFNWDYLDALKFQEWAVSFVHQHKDLSIIILTNHESCLTLGRGLQRKAGDTTSLVDFDPKLKNSLSIPVYDIKRGGGVTFHHPGQLVIYPIIKLTTYNLKVYSVINNLLKIVAANMQDMYGLEGFDYCRDLLGLWRENTKYASIGLQVRRFITFHGVALNLLDNELTNRNLLFVHPCGLPFETYGHISQLTKENINVADFATRLKEKLLTLIPNV